MELTVVADREFGEEVVPADGIEFLRCTFSGTTLLFAGDANFTLPECTGSFSIALGGAAATTMNQLALLHGCGHAGFVEGLFTRVRQPFSGTVN